MRASLPLVAMVLLALALPAAAQEREVELYRLPPQREPTTPGTYRDPVSSAIDAAHESVDRMATTKVEKFSRWDRAGFTEGARKAQFQQQTKLVEGAGKLAANNYFKALGWVSTLSDGGATIVGRLREKDLSGAAVALLDESAQATAATGGAWALGKLGAGLGLTFGGPPGMMIGGAVGGIAGGILATVGYNAYLSDSVSAVGDAAVAPVQSDHHDRDVALKNRIEWLVENGYPIPAILLEQEWAERDRQIRTPDIQPPPVFVVGPPVESKPPAGEPTLANPPAEFDLRPTSVSKRGYDLEGVAPEMVFRFRGRSVSVEHEFKMPINPSGVKSQDHGKYEITGTFADGRLVGKGSLVQYTRDIAQGVDFCEVRCEGNISGEAGDDGKLVIKCEWKAIQAQTRAASSRDDVPGVIWGEWKPWPDELRRGPREIEITLQLPVATPQSQQKPSPP